jgi:hypothetical protein
MVLAGSAPHHIDYPVVLELPQGATNQRVIQAATEARQRVDVQPVAGRRLVKPVRRADNRQRDAQGRAADLNRA